MSFDLGVWDKTLGITSDIYVRLCEGQLVPLGDSQLINAFYEDLTKRWPEIDSIPEEKIDDSDFCPWSCGLDRSGMHVIMARVWPKANNVSAYVEELAVIRPRIL